MKHYEVLVIGCGAMGSAIACDLAGRGFRTLVIERFSLGHTRGSSHGKSRIIRTAYFEDTRYVPLALRALGRWQELQREREDRIIRLTGGLMIGKREGRLVSGTLASARKHGLQHSIFSQRETKEAFPVFRMSDDEVAVYEKDAGVLFPENCIRAHVDIAKERGATFLFNEKVNRWSAGREGVSVETAKGEYMAQTVVLAAGPWTAELLDYGIPLVCERQVPFWFKPTDGATHFDSNKMPIFIAEEQDSRYFYGVPDFGEGVKVAEHHNGRREDPENPNSDVSKSDMAPVLDFVNRRLPGLGDPTGYTTCIYTNTPDENFIIDTYPSDDRLLIVSACSGHGFKFSCVVGEIVADMISEGRTKYDISMFRLDRFADRRFVGTI